MLAACPSVAVSMVRAATAAYPDSLASSGADLVVRVDVTVRADGSVKSVRVTHSSGQTDADKAALAAARSSRYHPASANCTPVEGHYAYSTTFVAPVTRSSELPPAT